MRNVQSTILKELGRIVHHNHALEEKLRLLQSQKKSLQTDIEKLEKQLSDNKRVAERAKEGFVKEVETLTNSYSSQLSVSKEEIDSLKEGE